MNKSLPRKVIELASIREFLTTQLDELVLLARNLLHEESVVYIRQYKDFYTSECFEFFSDDHVDLYAHVQTKVLKLRLLSELIRSSRSCWIFVSFSHCIDLSYELARACHAHIVTRIDISVGLSSELYLPMVGSLDDDYYQEDSIQKRVWLAPVDTSIDSVEHIELEYNDAFHGDLEDFEKWLLHKRVLKRRLGLIQRLEACLSEHRPKLISESFSLEDLRPKLASILSRKKVSSREIFELSSLIARYYCSNSFMAKRSRPVVLDSSKPLIHVRLDHSWLHFELIRYWLENNYQIRFFSEDLQILKTALIELRKWMGKHSELSGKWQSHISWSQWQLSPPYLRFSAFDRLDFTSAAGSAQVGLLSAPRANKTLVMEMLSGVFEGVWLPAKVVEASEGFFATSDLLRLAMLDEIEHLASYASTSMTFIFELLAKQGWADMENLDWWKLFFEHRLASDMLDSKIHLGRIPLDADFWIHREWKQSLKLRRESSKKYRHFQSAHWLSLHLFHFLALLYANMESRNHSSRELLLLHTFSPPAEWAGIKRFVSQWGLRRVEFYLLQYWPDLYQGGLNELFAKQS